MKKSGLQDMKNQNLKLVLSAVLEQGELSRIEIAQKTGLSPSTVSGLTGELLEKGIVTENGQKVMTAGRSRKALTMNPDYGLIAIVQIGRSGAVLELFDMSIELLARVPLSREYISGNDLLVYLTDAIFQNISMEALHAGHLRGFGLLFQEDMRASEFNVMYSTGFASANISLREALMTQFRTPVLEEYSQVYTVTDALNPENSKGSSAHISVGARVLASLVIDGKPIKLREGPYSDITPLMGNAVQRRLPGSENSAESLSGAASGSEQGTLVQTLAGMISALCTLFSLDTVFISGKGAEVPGFYDQLRGQVQMLLPQAATPQIAALKRTGADLSEAMAQRIRKRVLSLA